MNAHTTIAAASMLSLTVDAKALADAVQTYKATGANIIEGRNTIPIIGALLLEALPGKLTLHGTDLDCMLSIELPADVEATGAVAIEFDTLKKATAAAKKAKADTVTLAMMGGGRVSFQPSTGARVSLVTLDASDFPKLPYDASEFACWSADAEELRGDLDRLAPAVSPEESRYYLNGVFFHTVQESEGSAPVLRMAATDGHKLGRITRAMPDIPEGGLPDSILPKKAVHFLRRKMLKGRDTVSIGVNSQREGALRTSKFIAKAGNMRFVSKLIDGTFPDYSRVIPGTYPDSESWTVEADTMGDAARHVGQYAQHKHKGFKLSIGEGWATAFLQNDSGHVGLEIDGVEYVPGSKNDDRVHVTGVNSGYLAELMDGYAGQRVKFTMHDGAAPMRIESDDAPEFLCVCMPVRVDAVGKDVRAMSPAAIRKLDRNALEIFRSDMPERIEKARALEANPTNRPVLKKIREAATGKIISEAIDYYATAHHVERYQARAVILAELDAMCAPAPVEEPAPVEAEPVQDVEAEAGEPDATETVASDPTPAPVAADEPGEDEPAARYETLQEFKAAAGQGTRWIIENHDGEKWGGTRTRTVATVRARDLGFLGEDATLEQCRAADVRGGGGRSWIGFPKKDDWSSEGDWLVIYYSACDQAGRASREVPCLRMRLADAVEETTPVDTQPVETSDNTALIEQVAALSARVEELAAMVAAGASRDVQPVKRTEGHARAIRMAALQRDRVRGMKRDREHTRQHMADVIERAVKAEERADKAEAKVERLETRVRRLTAVWKGAKAKIATLGKQLLARRDHVDLRPAVEDVARIPAPAPVQAAPAKPAPAPAKRMLESEFDDDACSYAAAC